jgi:hypothetical protein
VSQAFESTQEELARRHRAAVRVVSAVSLFTLALIALGLSGLFSGALSFNPATAFALRLSIIFLAGGAFVFRRTRFSPVRLQDIAALRGASGLLETLQWTTVYVALIAGTIALFGFLVSMMTGYWTETVLLGGVALIVLLYCYPRRAAWQSVVAAADEAGPGETGRAAKGTIA